MTEPNELVHISWTTFMILVRQNNIEGVRRFFSDSLVPEWVMKEATRLQRMEILDILKDRIVPDRGVVGGYFQHHFWEPQNTSAPVFM